MPSQRDLGSELVVNHLTVKKAYEVLEAEGIIATERGRGTFVTAGVPRDLLNKGIKDIKARARDLADAAQLLGLDLDDYRKIIADAWTESEKGKGE